jgi:hypothetical protein
MKTTITLTAKNAESLAWAQQLTGLPPEDLINFFLVDYFQNFNDANPDSFPEATAGCMKFRDSESAERTLRWVIGRTRRKAAPRGKFPIIETQVRQLKGGRFEIHAFKTHRNGQCERVC